MRTLSAFGTTLWQLMNPVENQAKPERYSQHKQAMPTLALLREVGLSLQADDFGARFKEFSGKNRTPGFDNPLSRARSERIPMVATDEDGARGELDIRGRSQERSALTGERHRVAVPVPCMPREPLCPDAEPSASFTEHRYTGC